MKTCNGCKYADWHRTAAGKLHPSGAGECTYPWKMPELPSSMYWIGSPSRGGGGINRKKQFNGHCTYYVRAG